MTRGAARCSKKSRLSSVDVAARSTSTGVATLRRARVTRGGPLPSRAARDAPRLREVRDDPLRRRHVPRRVDAAVPRLGRVVVERRRRRASIIRRVGCDDRRDAVALLRRLDVVPSSRLSHLAFSPSAAHRVREPHRADVAAVRDPRRRRRSRLSVIRRTRRSRGGQRGARVRVGVDADADARARRASRRGVASTTPRRVAAPVVAASTSRRGVKPHRRDEPSDEHLSIIHRHRRARGVVFHPPAVPLTAAPSLSRARVRVRGEQHDVTRASGRSRRTSRRRV